MRENCPIVDPDQIRPSQEVNLPAQAADTNAKRCCSMPLSHALLAVFLLLLMTLPAYAFATDEQPANVLHFRTRNSMILVAVNIDGQNKTLIFDTGAEQTLMHWPQVSRGKKMVLWQRDYYYIDEEKQPDRWQQPVVHQFDEGGLKGCIHVESCGRGAWSRCAVNFFQHPDQLPESYN